TYTLQLVLDLEGELDVAVLQTAGQALLNRYPHLRTALGRTVEGRSVAILARWATLPWRVADLSNVDPALRSAEAARLLADDRSRRFDLAQPPLLRMLLVRVEPGHHRLGVTAHRALLDGWSVPLVLRELVALYASRGDLAVLAPTPQYREYLAWLVTQYRPAAELAWRQALAGLKVPTLVAPADQQRPPLVPDRVIVELSEAQTTAVTGQARALGVTLSTVLQGAWGLLLRHLTGQDDVVFGVTVSGRPAELAGVETMVGLLMNNVLARVRFRPGEPMSQLLLRLHAEQAELAVHHHLGLADIQRPAGLGQLFDTLLAVENFPSDPGSLRDVVAGLRVTDEEHWTSHYPLMLMAAPGPRLTLVLAYRPELYDRATVEGLAARLAGILGRLAVDPGQTVDGVG
ncbi:MAG: condensation domain-containing protein, partial [Pseudonocardiaceae bacterium]